MEIIINNNGNMGQFHIIENRPDHLGSTLLKQTLLFFLLLCSDRVGKAADFQTLSGLRKQGMFV